ncbi:MAG: D-2-hydroxyacid dehydrogenase [Phycisphaerales bacterium]|jgi:glycerate dehydrogenase|nr:D-2-hydroxyacid dehydrogenase [Phycisphaerales bacterium]
MKIVVLDGYTLNPGDNPWGSLRALGEVVIYDRTPVDQIVERSAGAEVVLTNKVPLSSTTLAQLPKLKLIAVLATGYNIVDIEAARLQGVVVCNVPTYSTESVAQFTFALLLELCHRVGAHDALVHDGEWTRSADFCFWRHPLIELSGKTMGIVGFGRIGRRVGQIAEAFGMKVLAGSASVSAARGDRVSLEELFSRSDVISLHCPQTPANTGFVNRELLRLMKPTALLINTARGGLVNEKDLAEALNEDRLGGAAVDVVSAEPMKGDNPLLGAKNCIITPHIAWATLAARRRLMETTVRNVAAFMAGRPENVVNPI